MAGWRIAVAALAVAAYLALSHLLTLHAGEAWGLAACVAPLWLAAAVIAVRRRSAAGIAALLLLAGAVGWIVARGGFADVRQLYLLQHAGIHLGLGVLFALSLRPGRLSLIGGVAERVHGSLTPAMRHYASRVTLAWVVYFFAMALASLLVFRLASWAAWSLLANIVTPLAIGALFVGEHLLRYRLHPEFERAGLIDAARAYRRDPRAAPR